MDQLLLFIQLGDVILGTKITALCFSLFVKIFKLKLKSVMQALDITLLGLRPRVGIKLLGLWPRVEAQFLWFLGPKS